MRFRLLALLTLALAELAGAQTHPALRDADLAPLIPVRRFVANIDYSGDHRISPDGRKLLWSEVVRLDQGLAVRAIDGTDVRRIATGRLARSGTAPIYMTWLADSRHVAYVRDLTGDENTQIFVIDTDEPDKTPLRITPWPKVRSLVVSTTDPGGGKFHFISNRRDASEFDLYEADFRTGEVQEVLRNPGGVTQWVIDTGGKPGGRVRLSGKEPDADRVFEVLDGSTWRELKRWDGFSFSGVWALDRLSGFALLSSDIGRDTLSVVELTLADGREKVLFSDPRVDYYASHRATDSARVFAVRTVPDYPQTTVLDAELDAAIKRALEAAVPRGLLGFVLGNADRELKRLLIYPLTVEGSRTLLFDRDRGSTTLLLDETVDAEVRALVPELPISYAARDGLKIHGYLLRPAGTEGRRVPLAVLVHGGPWTRDYWNSKRLVSDHSFAQFLANRGYAVLMVNYRGSFGYGRRFMDAGIGELGNKSQDDIADGVRWAIAEGIADSTRIAIVGASFGGYSVYMNLIRSPELYACGVSTVGVANWVRAIEEFPPYWKNSMHVFDRFYGNPQVPAERARLMEQSPITHIEKIRAPLLVIHGGNDVRVMKQDSEDVVAALRAAGKPVDYLLFPDEGHSIRKWQNRLTSFRRVEEFLAICLGGRSGGVDLYELFK